MITSSRQVWTVTAFALAILLHTACQPADRLKVGMTQAEVEQLEKWLAAQGIVEDKLLWRRSDCGLMPDFGKPKEPRPLLRGVRRHRNTHAGVVAKILVGTDQNGIDGAPKFDRMDMMRTMAH